MPGLADGREVFRLRAAGFRTVPAPTKQPSGLLADSTLMISGWPVSVEDARVQERGGLRQRLCVTLYGGRIYKSGSGESSGRGVSNNGIRAESAPYTNGTKTTHRVYIPDLPDKETAEAILRGLSKTGSFNGAKILRSFNIVD